MQNNSRFVLNRESGNQQQILLSFIVPVFNTEMFVLHALNSINHFSPVTFEIIVVHDGGTDNSLALLIAWANAHDCLNIKIIDQDNAGLSAARHTGLGFARGQYVAFLDSDDLADGLIYTRAAAIASERGCDVVLFRSAVLNGVNLETSAFYDADIWDDILSNRSYIQTNIHREPRLLRLEPNMNCRVTRRKLYLEKRITHPIGLFFEDLLPSVQSFCVAEQVGLMSDIGYYYRVFRYGKITDRRGRMRFDSLQCVKLANAFIMEQGLIDEALANYLLQACRLLAWCGENVLNDDKVRFSRDALTLLAALDKTVCRLAWSRFARSDRDRMILKAVYFGDASAFNMITRNMSPNNHLTRDRFLHRMR